jgi:hypothetical protein
LAVGPKVPKGFVAAGPIDDPGGHVLVKGTVRNRAKGKVLFESIHHSAAVVMA